MTVWEACQQYAAWQRTQKDKEAADDTVGRFKQYACSTPIARVPLSKLRPAQVRTWRASLAETPINAEGNLRSAATLNRDLVCVRAALNWALDERLVATDRAWRKALEPVTGANARRTLYLTREERLKLIRAARPDAGLLMRAMCSVPLRPGALAGLTVGRFIPHTNELMIQVDKTSSRAVKLPESTAKLLRRASKGKGPDEPLLTRRDGAPWEKTGGKSSWPAR